MWIFKGVSNAVRGAATSTDDNDNYSPRVATTTTTTNGPNNIIPPHNNRAAAVDASMQNAYAPPNTTLNNTATTNNISNNINNETTDVIKEDGMVVTDIPTIADIDTYSVGVNKSTESIYNDINIKQETRLRNQANEDERIGLQEFSPYLLTNDTDTYIDYSFNRGSGVSRRGYNSQSVAAINNSNRTAHTPRRRVTQREITIQHSPPKINEGNNKRRGLDKRDSKSSNSTSMVPPVVHRSTSSNNANVYGQSNQQPFYQQQQQQQYQHSNQHTPQVFGFPPQSFPPQHQMLNRNHFQPYGMQHTNLFSLNMLNDNHPPYKHVPHTAQPSTLTQQTINRITHIPTQQQNTTTVNTGITNDNAWQSNNNNNTSNPNQLQSTRTLNGNPEGIAAMSRRLTSDELRDKLPEGLNKRGDYVLRDVRSIHGGSATGYLRPFNGPEQDALYNVNDGMVTSHIVVSQNLVTEKPKAGEEDKLRATRSFGDPLLSCENKRTVYCKCKGCDVMGQIWRINYGNDELGNKTSGLLYYEKINRNTNCPYKHDEVSHANSTGRSECSLTTQQKQFIVKWAQRKTPSKSEQRDMVDAMIESTDIKTTSDQDNDSETFVKRVGAFIQNSKRDTSERKYFQKHTINDSTTSNELRDLLNHLKSEEGSTERNRKYNLEGIGQYLLSTEGKQLNNLIKVYDHDHNGTTWSYIQFEYLHAAELAQQGAQIYSDKKVQLEMDYFHTHCEGDEWIVGHTGFSDASHKYYPLSMIISKSENHTSAGRLLTRGTNLLQSAFGDARSVLVDGGKALAKAIGKENESRQARDAAVVGTATEGEQIDEVCDEIMETLINSETDNVAALEARLSNVLSSHKLEVERCVAHITRKACSRGGGWRGGKGSLCRALLNGGCSMQKMQRVRVCYVCMSMSTFINISAC